MSAAGLVPTPPERRERRHWIIEGIATQGRVIGALIMREMQTRFGRHNLGFLWLFFEPLFLGCMVGLMHYAHGERLPGGVNPFLFSIAGYVPFFMFRTMVNRAGGALHANLTLLFHRQVTPVDVMISRNLLEAASVIGVIVIILTVAIWLAGVWPDNVGLVFFSLLLMALLCHGLSMNVAALVSRWEGADRLIHPLTYLMLPLSGAFFALHWLPRWAREALLWNPLVSVHEAIRHGIFGNAFPTYYDLTYVGECILIFNLFGLLALRTARRKLEIF
ncbi:capsular polysaccharide transport system permease protein [Roseomonas rosea]|uniref:Capsular polysaccharide transport system permease protein n=1 Tax=Muricoccus roseus TaxID=198092 RepID=A0A1M6G5P1_9PROT|nr:ABC transporter permease [Roseomonas rosea]SHJ05328.1 capsular polysaccharide transport system permease protein [Roseomonas rosea]